MKYENWRSYLLKNKNHFLWQFKKRVEPGFSSKKVRFHFYQLTRMVTF